MAWELPSHIEWDQSTTPNNESIGWEETDYTTMQGVISQVHRQESLDWEDGVSDEEFNAVFDGDDTLEWGARTDELNESMEQANIQLINSVMEQLWFSYTRTEPRAWLMYSDGTTTISLFWWIRGVPTDTQVSVSDVVARILDTNGLNHPDAREYISQTLQWITLPREVFDGWNVNSIEDLPNMVPYLQAYESISYREYTDMKDTIIRIVHDELWVMLDSDFSLSWNLSTGRVTSLRIEWRWIDRRDPQHGLSDVIVKFSWVPEVSMVQE